MKKYSQNKLPKDILTETASKVRDLRKQVKMSQLELAKRSGVSHGSIKRFEQTGQISFESFLKILHVLNRLSDIETLFESNQDMDNIEQLFSDKTRF